MGKALMHLDGCHFYVWVSEDLDGQIVLAYADRVGSDLRLHGRFGHDEDGTCEDCRALRDRKRKPLSVSKHIPALPDDPKATFAAVLEHICEIQERSGGDDA
jgi:hypothetical protein